MSTYLFLTMNQKTTLLVLGLTLAVTTALAVAPIVNEIAFAIQPMASGGHGSGHATIHKGGNGAAKIAGILNTGGQD